MRYPYHVKANGRYYAPNEEIIEVKDMEQSASAESSAESSSEENRPPEKQRGRRKKAE